MILSRMQGLAALLQDILDDNLPESIKPYLLSCRLTALNKRTGGIRPIAVSELFYKLAAKFAASCAGKTARHLVSPHQFGIATSHGCEKNIHRMQHCLTDSS